jgi:hypothetical protein
MVNQSMLFKSRLDEVRLHAIRKVGIEGWRMLSRRMLAVLLPQIIGQISLRQAVGFLAVTTYKNNNQLQLNSLG